MATWICPLCDRSFGRRNQSHTCVPSNTVDDYFEGRPAVQREICDAVTDYLESLGPVIVDAVQVGVLYKRAATFADLRGMRDRVRLILMVSAPRESSRPVREVQASANRTAYFFDVREPSDIDEEMKDWLAEYYFSARE